MDFERIEVHGSRRDLAGAIDPPRNEQVPGRVDSNGVKTQPGIVESVRSNV